MLPLPARIEAARLLLAATAGGARLGALPDASQPATVDDALGIQKLLIEQSHGVVCGWKVSTNPNGEVMWGAIFETDCFPSPATIDAETMPLMGVEGEIAFRFTRDLPARAQPYSRAEIEAVLVAFPAIEIVDSRFQSYTGTPVLHRLADRMSNGGMVLGTPVAHWQSIDLSTLQVTLTMNGAVILEQRGGHARLDPLLPAIEFIHSVQASLSFRASQFITTGTFTGLNFGQTGQRFEVEFKDFGHVALCFR